MRYGLFGKTVVTIEGVDLRDVDLTAVADVAARALDVNTDQVWVVGASDRTLELDVMADSIDLQQWEGRERAFLTALSSVPGVQIGADTTVSGQGILGSISWSPEGSVSREQVARAAERIQAMRFQRAVVFATGDEILDGRVMDQNSTHIESVLGEAGIRVELGGALADDPVLIAGAIENALGRGAGWIILTGGVGDDDRDCTRQAIRHLDPDAVEAPVAVFQHASRSSTVAVCVGSVEGALVIALPGPTSEVVPATAALARLVGSPYTDPQEIAHELARAVTATFQERHRASRRHI